MMRELLASDYQNRITGVATNRWAENAWMTMDGINNREMMEGA